MPKKIAIIGGGIAGLSAGCYGRMNGFDTEIFEMHTVPGGVCTGWKRKDYIFDGCLHWLTGSAPSNPFFKIWEELGAIRGKRIVNHDEFSHIVLPSGRRLVQHADIRKLVGSLKKEFPEDSKALDILESDVMKLGDFRRPEGSAGPIGLFRKIRGLLEFSKYMPVFSRYPGSMTDFTARFKNPELRQFFMGILIFPDMPGIFCVSLLAMLTTGDSGWP